MPTITNPGVIPALVTAFLLNDSDKGAAMRDIGYSENYSTNGHCAKLFDRADVKTEIRRQRVELIKKTGYSKEQAHQDLIDDRRLARDQKQPSAAISADSQLIRLYGMDQVDGSSTAEQRILSEINSAQAKLIAEQIVLNANRPKLIESKEIKK